MWCGGGEGRVVPGKLTELVCRFLLPVWLCDMVWCGGYIGCVHIPGITQCISVCVAVCFELLYDFTLLLATVRVVSV